MTEEVETQVLRSFFAGDQYIKYVNFNKAVLWKDQEISLNPRVFDEIRARKVKFIVFMEGGEKKERWEITTDSFLKHAVIKQEGQEPQYYCPIKYFSVNKLHV